VHQTRYSPIFFGRTAQFRFDAPSHEYGTLYVAEDEFGAFVETFGRILDHYGYAIG
jgi:hypothetical protein